jgi:hypothetical protein
VRPPPCLLLVIPLEDRVVARVEALTHEDELRLRSWLRRSETLAALAELLPGLLGELHEEANEEAGE